MHGLGVRKGGWGGGPPEDLKANGSLLYRSFAAKGCGVRGGPEDSFESLDASVGEAPGIRKFVGGWEGAQTLKADALKNE